MNTQLLLENVRGVLIRLEETIIFNLIERAQFKRNDVIYRPDAFGPVLQGESLVGYMLHETEKVHARMRRYLSPDEHPFFNDLPAPVLPAMHFTESPLQPNRVNLNPDVRRIYEKEIVPRICAGGDDNQYGSSATCDVACLQSISRRVHYGKFVAESKYRDNPDVFRPLIAAGDRAGLLKAITHPEVEQRLLARIRIKASTYGQDVSGDTPNRNLDPETVLTLYADWIVPLNKQVQIDYLLGRNTNDAA